MGTLDGTKSKTRNSSSVVSNTPGDLSTAPSFEIAQVNPNAYELPIQVMGEKEEYMISAFHEQAVAIEGHAAVARLVDVRLGELGVWAEEAFASAVEGIADIETHTQAGKYGKLLENFNVHLITRTGQAILETNTITARQMHTDMVRSVDMPAPAPVKEEKKGILARMFGA